MIDKMNDDIEEGKWMIWRLMNMYEDYPEGKVPMSESEGISTSSPD